MANNHIITKTYNNLKGYSTESIFIRPPYVATKALNIMRSPDGTFSPRRGFQGLVADIGGLGNTTFDNPCGCGIEVLTLHRDGNLYRLLNETLTIAYTGIGYLTVNIYTGNANNIASTVTLNNAAQVNGAQIAVNVITVDAGHAVLLGNTVSFVNTAGTTITRTVTGVAATTITISGAPVSVADNVRIKVVLTVSFGRGFDDLTTYSIQDWITALSTISGITATASGVATYPAAFLPLLEPTNVTSGTSQIVDYSYWEIVPCPINPAFPGSAVTTNQNSEDFENATFADFDEVLYISNGYDVPRKYDGQNLYLAGMIKGVRPTTTVAGTGITGTYRYAITYEQVDNAGHIIEGEISLASPDIVAANNTITVTVTNLLANSGYNTNAATVNGNQVNVNTINVNALHTFLVGDTAYFRESPTATVNGAQANVLTIAVNAGHHAVIGDLVTFLDSAGALHNRTILSTTATTVTVDGSVLTFAGGEVMSSYKSRLITATTPTSITLEGPPTSVLNNQIISNNLKINIYRNVNGGLEYFLVASIPNNPFAATQTFADITPDAEVGIAFSNPIRAPNPPPISKYIISFRNQLIYAGGSATDTSFNDEVFFSEGNQPEAVPAATNFFIVPPNDDDVSGVGVSGSTLVVGKGRSIYAISGDLLTSQFQVTPVAPGTNIGFAAQATVKSVGGLLYFLSTNGVYSMSESQLFPTDPFGNPVPLSIPIDLIFRQIPFEADKRLVFKRATAINYTKDNQYLLFIPCENSNSTIRVANSNSRVYCFDYQGKNWFEWSNINAAGGFYTIDDNLYWQERRFSGFVGNTANVYRQHRYYRLIDQSDHTSAIFVDWLSSWEDIGYPEVRKKFIRCMLLIDRIEALDQLNQPNLQFTSYVDRLPGLASTQANVTTVDNASVWSNGPDVWGWGVWSGYQDSFIRVNLKQGTVSKSMQIGLVLNQLNASFRLQGFQLEIAPDFRKTFVR